ncbi:hypothetical protein BpHYR1_010053 [Brachionus plicatilis]|uniref:Uncharacterized protein n=1 Tax=Brachionus plicatilis TaxID=10195 RepID=A0A3M7R944_BRAPC|nr:hypothetical protein BpHYR1_010053 [Brachionus plicatilis]
MVGDDWHKCNFAEFTHILQTCLVGGTKVVSFCFITEQFCMKFHNAFLGEISEGPCFSNNLADLFSSF